MVRVSPDKTIWINRGWQTAHIGFCPSEKAWDDLRKRMEFGHVAYPPNEGLQGCCTRFTTENGSSKKTALIVTVHPTMDEMDQTVAMGLVAHECVHVWQFVKEKMGEKSPGDEVEAYAIQSIFQDMWEAYLDTRKPTFKSKSSQPRKK